MKKEKKHYVKVILAPWTQQCYDCAQCRVTRARALCIQVHGWVCGAAHSWSQSDAHSALTWLDLMSSSMMTVIGQTVLKVFLLSLSPWNFSNKQCQKNKNEQNSMYSSLTLKWNNKVSSSVLTTLLGFIDLSFLFNMIYMFGCGGLTISVSAVHHTQVFNVTNITAREIRVFKLISHGLAVVLTTANP